MADLMSIVGAAADPDVIAPQPGPQTILMLAPCQDILYGGARGGGKTRGVIIKIVQHVQKWGDKAKVIVFRRSYRELEEVQAQCKEVFSRLGWNYKKMETTWFAPNGAVVRLRYLKEDKDADKYQGHQYTLIIVEEIGNFRSPEPIKKIKATLRSAHGVHCQFIATANPGGPGHDWVKEEYITPSPPMIPHNDPITGIPKMFIPSKLEDNPILMINNPQYSNQLKGTGPEWLVRAWRQGDWNIHPGGNVFKREYWKRYKTLPVLTQIVGSWDTGYKTTDDSDRSAGTFWGMSQNAIYLLGAWAGKEEFPELINRVKAHAVSHECNITLIEDKASGQSLIQSLRRHTRLPVKAISVDDDKLARAYSVTPLIEGGTVYIPEEPSEWLNDYVEEMAAYPQGRYDDFVDSTSQALAYMSKLGEKMEKMRKHGKVVPIRRSIYAR